MNYIAKNDPELLILLPPSPEHWHYRHCHHIQFYMVLETETRAFCVLGKHSTNWVTSPGSQFEERNVLEPQFHVLWTNRGRFRVGSLSTSSSFFRRDHFFLSVFRLLFSCWTSVYWAFQQWLEGWSPAATKSSGSGKGNLGSVSFPPWQIMLHHWVEAWEEMYTYSFM